MHRAANHAADHGESACTPGVYRRRRPERTLAWQTVQAWLATWIAHHDEADAESVPAYVQRELKRLSGVRHPRARLRAGALSGLHGRVPGGFLLQRQRRVPVVLPKRMAATVSASGRLSDPAGADAAVGAGFAEAFAPSTT